MQDVRALLSEQLLLAVAVEGEPVESEWPDDDGLPGSGLESIADEEIVNDRTVVFGEGFTIDGEKFTGEVKQTMCPASALMGQKLVVE